MTIPDHWTPIVPAQPTPYTAGEPEYGTRMPGNTAMFFGPTPPVKKSRLPLILGVVAGLILIIAATVAITLQAGSNAAPNDPVSRDGDQVTNGATTRDPTPPPNVVPEVADFELTPKILERQCFGSAGCNVTFRIELAYNGRALSEDDTWLITYEVSGVEDGPLIASTELTGTTYSAGEEHVGTRSNKSKLTIKVTSVDKVGL